RERALSGCPRGSSRSRSPSSAASSSSSRSPAGRSSSAPAPLPPAGGISRRAGRGSGRERDPALRRLGGGLEADRGDLDGLGAPDALDADRQDRALALARLARSVWLLPCLLGMAAISHLSSFDGRGRAAALGRISGARGSCPRARVRVAPGPSPSAVVR